MGIKKMHFHEPGAIYSVLMVDNGRIWYLTICMDSFKNEDKKLPYTREEY
jgi:hypothetical protein